VSKEVAMFKDVCQVYVYWYQTFPVHFPHHCRICKW